MRRATVSAVLAVLVEVSFSPGGGAILFSSKAESPDTAAIESIEGRWINPAGSVIIVIAQCGDTKCGTVEWASEKAQEDARKGTDQLIGAQLLYEVRPVRGDRWEGRLFVPDMNRRLHAKIELLDRGDALKVFGCAIGRSLCKSQVWTRTPTSEQ